MMTLDLTDEEKQALICQLREKVEIDRFPHPSRLDPAEGDPGKAQTALAVGRRAAAAKGAVRRLMP